MEKLVKFNIQKMKIMASSPITSWQIDGRQWKQWQTLFSWASKSLQMTCFRWWFHEIKRCLLLRRKATTNLDSILKSRDITLLTKVRLVKAMIFPVVLCGCESWTIRKLNTEELMLLNCGVGEDSWGPLDCKKVQPVHPKGDQSWVFIGRTDVEAEAPILWPPNMKSQLIGCDAEKD